jgi:hypothetical protein
MATVTHYIRSEYDAEADKDRLLRETGQEADDDDVEALDPWQTESSSAGFHVSRRLANAPKFVPALLSYDEWGNISNPTYAESTPTSSNSPHGDVASWYRSLSRQGPNPTWPQQQSASHSSATRHRTPEATPEPSSSSPSITAPVPSSSIHSTGTLASSARVESRRRHRGGHDWFISRAISQSQSQSASAPPSPRPSDSLADILSRYGPSTEPIRPPVFLHLGPSNKGWTMLQNQGWSEGEGLGAGSKRNDAHAKKETLQTEKEKGKKKMRFDTRSPSAPVSMLPTSTSTPLSQERATKGEHEEEEILIDDDDDDPIVEIRKKAHVPIIDLTQSDTESDDEGEDEDDQDDNDDNNDTIDENDDDDDLNSRAPPSTSSTTHTEKTTTSSDDPRATQTALLTPLPTVLKSDRLGIGLKAKTEGPYRSSVKRVTHNAAALAAHVKAAEDRRRTQRLLGRGRRAFARADRLERERRENMMAYLSEP